MFIKKLEIFFISMMIISVLVLLTNWYNNYVFKNTPISQDIVKLIESKEQEVLINMQKNYGFTYKFPLIITDKIQSRLYGVTSYERGGEIKIYLNKKVMQESLDYILDTVIAHEYAHALLFKQNAYRSRGDGHTPLWKETCDKLGGINCEQYVNHKDVVMGKMPF